MMNKVVHFEIPADDLARAKKFYEGVFGWKTMDVPEMDYTMAYTTEVNEKQMPKEVGAINGGMMMRDEMITSPVVTLSTENIDMTMEKLISMGGMLVKSKQMVGEMGWSAYAKDSEGNVIGLWQDSGKM